MKRSIAFGLWVGLLTLLPAAGSPNQRPAQEAQVPPLLPKAGAKVPLTYGGGGMWAVDERLLISAADGGLHAFDLETSQAAWSFQSGSRTPGPDVVAVPRGTGFQDLLSAAVESVRNPTRGVSSVVVEGDTVFAGSFDGLVYALDAKTGKRKWSQAISTDGPNAVSVLMRHGDMLALSSQSTVLAVDATTGEKKWSFDTLPETRPGARRRPPVGLAVSGDLLYATSWPFGRADTMMKTFLHAVDINSGRSRWTFEVDECDPTTPTTAGGLVLFHTIRCVAGGNQTARPTLYALDGASGQLKWKLQTDVEWGLNRIEVAGDMVVFATDRGVFAVALETGQERWSNREKQLIPRIGILLIWLYGQNVYVGREGRLFALDLASGRLRWSVKGADSVAAIRGGVLYVTGSGQLLALQPESGRRLWSFKPGGDIAFWRERLFVASGDQWIFGKAPKPGYLHNLSAKTGRLEP